MTVVGRFIQQLQTNDVRYIRVLLGEELQGKSGGLKIRFAIPQFHLAGVDATVGC